MRGPDRDRAWVGRIADWVAAKLGGMPTAVRVGMFDQTIRDPTGTECSRRNACRQATLSIAERTGAITVRTGRDPQIDVFDVVATTEPAEAAVSTVVITTTPRGSTACLEYNGSVSGGPVRRARGPN